MSEEIKCEVCGKNFKTTQALAGHMQGACGNHSETTTSVTRESRSVAKSGSLDNAIEKLQVPMVPPEYNGAAQIYWEGFNKGVNFGANTILVGIRSAQELSSLGIAQATPIIKMAQEMRQAEGQAAQAIAAELAQATLQGNQQLMGAINSLAQSHKPESPNPMMQVMADTMAPFLQQVMQSAMGGMLGGFQAKTAAGQMASAPAQNQSPQPQSRSEPAAGGTGDSWGSLPDNVQPITEEDMDV